MFRNYLKIAVRNLGKHKIHAFINISGLALGMGCCLLLFLLIQHEWGFDRFHTNSDRLYRVGLRYVKPDGEIGYQNMMFPDFTPQLAVEFPTIEKATRLVGNPIDLQVGNEFFRTDVVEVDAGFFEMFSFPLVAGDPAAVIVDPSSIVVTTDVADRFFGLGAGRYDEAIGRTISFTRDDVEHDFVVSGVSESPPENSSINFEAVISFENYEAIRLGGNNYGGRTSTYVLLEENASAETFETALQPFMLEQFAEYIEGMRDNDFIAEGDDALFMFAQPILDMHWQPDVWTAYEVDPQDPVFSYILGGIGLLVLIIACINFTTLTIGRSTTRQLEVGLRKAFGAQRSQLMYQFWGEAVVLTAISLILGGVLAALTLPLFNDVTAKALSLSAVPPAQLAAVAFGLLFVVGLVAGGYPAAVLSRFQPAVVLKGNVMAGSRQGLTRSLVVLQYTISIGLMICTLIMAQQLAHIANKDLGYKKDLVMVVHANQVGRQDADLVINRFKNTLASAQGVTAIARSGQTFNRGTDRNSWTDENGITRQAYNYGVGHEFVDLMDMKIVAGRNFSPEFPSDSSHAILVNEALVKNFGIENPVGKQLTNWLNWIYDESPVIVGVVKDFHFQSLHREIEPVVLNMHPGYYNYFSSLLVKLKPEDVTGSIEDVEAAWISILPGRPFTYSFLDEDVARQYVEEERWNRIVRYSSILAILIACLGMFGLATLAVARRTKEIGVRKVLGASVSDVLRLIATEFAVLVAVASVLAFPMAYFGMSEWLSDFASRTEIGWPVFALAAVASLGIALLSISYHAIRAATADPIHALRYE